MTISDPSAKVFGAVSPAILEGKYIVINPIVLRSWLSFTPNYCMENQTFREFACMYKGKMRSLTSFFFRIYILM